METRKNTENLANFYLEVMDMENDKPALEWNVTLDPEKIKRWSQGEAALAVAPPEFDSEKVYDRFYSVAKACQKWQAGPQPVTDEFIKNLEGLDKPQRDELIEALFQVKGHMSKWAKLLNVPAELIDFIAFNTFKPLLKIYGEKVLEQLTVSDWTKGYCPVCGDQPTMAKLTGKDGHRELYCSRCETTWRFKRLGCPYCEEETASEASFITLDDNKQYRIYLCDRCKSYLKTVDERVCGEVDLFCEDLATVELDHLARTEGYQRGDKRQQV